MNRSSLLAAFAVAFALSLSSGCHLYFGDGDGRDGRAGGGWDDDGDWGNGGPGEPGWDCSNDYDCAAGCVCNPDGVCEETGFCDVGAGEMCADGYECDDARSTCVPVCETNADCGPNQYCETSSGMCLDSWGCDTGTPCEPGFICEDNVCVPQPCDDDGQCFEGCYCDEATGECVETGTCGPDGSCPDGLKCDDRNTCIPLECSDLTTSAECSAADGCYSVFTGVNCTDTSSGLPCDEEGATCTCESFVFDRCIAEEPTAE